MNDSADRMAWTEISMPPSGRSKNHPAREKSSYRLLISRRTSNGKVFLDLTDQKHLRIH
jgi:hypothetical protein